MASRDTRKVKVLHVAASSAMFPRFRMELLIAQRELGYHVEVACRPDRPYVDQVVAQGIVVRPVRWLVNSLRPFHIVVAVAQLVRLIREHGYDVVHGHQPMGILQGVLAAKMAGVPVVLCTTGGFKTNEGMQWLTRRLSYLGEKALLSMADAVFSVNYEDVELARRTGIAPPDRIYYVGPRGGCGIDLHRFQPMLSIAGRRKSPGRAEFGLGPSDRVVGMVARCVWEKGFREAILAIHELVPQHPRLRLLLIGDGKDQEAIADFANCLGLLNQHVFLTGRRNDVPDLLRLMDLFVLPSYREGMPVALLEAMASGLPVVASDVRGSREVVCHRRTGLLVPAKSAADLVKAIGCILDSDPLADRLGTCAREFVERNCSTEVLLPRTMALYDRIVGERLRKERFGVAVA